MSGHIVRYLVYVRVCYLLLGWWYLSLTACNHLVMGKPRRKKNTMAKNIARKSIALASGIALATSGLAALPAQAVETLDTTLNAGIHYNTVTGYGNGVTLKTTINASYSASDDYLSYRIVNTGTATVEALFGAGDIDENVDQTTGIFYEYGKSVALADADTAQDGSTGRQTADNDFVLNLGTGALGLYTANNLLQLSVKDATAKDYTLTVQAWLDVNQDNTIDSTEWAGPVKTLNFYDETNVAATTTITSSVVGASYVEAEITTTPALNGNALGADFFDVSLTAQGNTNAVLVKNTSSDAGLAPTLGTTTYSSTTDKWTAKGYVKYSKATDAWTGTDGTVAAIANLATVPATVAITSVTKLATMADFTHGITASGSFVATFTDLDSGSPTNVAANSDFIAVPLTYVSATSATWLTAAAPELAFLTAGAAEDVTGGSVTFWSVGANATVQAAGVYSATPYIGALKVGAIGSTSSDAETASGITATIVGTNNIEAGINEDGSSQTTIAVRSGTTTVSASAVLTYTDSNSEAQLIGAGVPVTCSATAENGGGTVTVNGGTTASAVVLTDAASSVTCSVTTSTAAAADSIDFDIRPQSLPAGNAAAAKFDLTWADADYVLYDTNVDRSQPASSTLSYRSIDANGTYTFQFAYTDQFGVAAPDSTYRLQVVNANRTVSSDYHSLVAGQATVSVADAAQGATSNITTTVNVQKLASGTWGAVAADSWNASNNGKVQINVVTAQTDSITLDTGTGQTFEYDNSANVARDVSVPIAAKATVAQDRRFTNATQPVYTNAVVVHGRVSNSATGLVRAGQLVTVTGPSNILFSSGNKDAFGSLTVVTSDEGDFTVLAYSNIAQSLTDITFTTTAAATKTEKITFEPVAITAGVNVSIAMPAFVSAGSTFQPVITVTDKYGNAVDTTGDALSITYTGPGIVFGTIATDTDANGQAKFAVLLGANDTGSPAVSVVYDANNNGTYGTASADIYGLTPDYSATASAVIGTATVVSATKVNAGSFKGYVALYAKGYKGQRMSAKVGKDWVVVASLASDFERVVEFTGAGVDVAVRIYIDRVLMDTINLTTK
jgi:hypothetical protein